MRLIFFTSLIILFTGCKSLKQSDYLIEKSKNSSLPNLLPTIDNKNLHQKITVDNVVYTPETPSPESNPKITVDGFDVLYVKTTDSRVKDLLKLFNIYVTQNLCDNTKDISGKIALEITHYKQKRNPAITLISAWTLFTINLLGIPSRVITTDLEIKISILNRNNLVVKSYSSKAKVDAYTALYWGYGDDTRRISSVNAIKKAFEEIQIKINKDVVEITGLITQ